MEVNTKTKEKNKIKIKKPKQYKVVMHNDDFTTMEFVVYILVQIFNKNMNDANKIMMDVHSSGKGIVGIFTYDIAITKVNLALVLAKKEGFPFNITVEEV